MTCEGLSRTKPTEIRSEPYMLIVDENGEVIAHLGGAPEEDVGNVLAFMHKVRRLIAELRSDGSSSSFDLPGDRRLRGYRLCGLADTYAIFVERARQPISANDLVAKFSFSPREAEVVLLVIHGAASQAIAQQLGIGETTVVSHVRNAGLKIGCTKRSTMIARILGIGDADADAV